MNLIYLKVLIRYLISKIRTLNQEVLVFFSIFPVDIQKTILTFMNLPTLGNMSRVDSKLMSFCIPLILEKSKLYLENKYKFYKEEEENLRIKNPRHPPSLLMDALFSGPEIDFPHTSQHYSNIIGEDIKKIVLLFPESINYCHVGTQDKFNFFPLTVACWNSNIPTEIVEFLFKEISSHAILYVDVEYLKNINLERIKYREEEEIKKYAKIMELFAQYKDNIVGKQKNQTLPCGCNSLSGQDHIV